MPLSTAMSVYYKCVINGSSVVNVSVERHSEHESVRDATIWVKAILHIAFQDIAI